MLSCSATAFFPAGNSSAGGVFAASSELAGSSEVFDPDSGTFSLANAVLSATRAGHTATLVTDGDDGSVILLAGGIGRASADMLIPGTDPLNTAVRAPKNSMGALRGFHVAAVVGIAAPFRVLVAGGEDLGGTALAVADEFAPTP